MGSEHQRRLQHRTQGKPVRAFGPGPGPPQCKRPDGGPGFPVPPDSGTIALRHAHPALENRSGLEFISSGAPKEALAYIRSCLEEKLLVVINPYKEAVSLSFDGKIGEAVYLVGEAATQKGKEILAPAISAGVYRIL